MREAAGQTGSCLVLQPLSTEEPPCVEYSARHCRGQEPVRAPVHAPVRAPVHRNLSHGSPVGRVLDQYQLRSLL